MKYYDYENSFISLQFIRFTEILICKAKFEESSKGLFFHVLLEIMLNTIHINISVSYCKY